MNKLKILCTICARQGSQGVSNKNIKIIKNLPLIAHTIIQAKQSKIFDNIIVSSDSEKIMNISEKYGASVFFKRPKILAKNTSPKIPVIIHALKKSELYFNKKYDIIVDLDPTSPLRKILDIKKSLELFNKMKSSNLVSVSNASKNPYFNMLEIINNKVKLSKSRNIQILRRQDSPKVYDMNASIYIWNRKYLLNKSKLINSKTLAYIMPENRSIDIDTPFDFKIVKYIMENK